MKVLAISGSLRKASVNTALLRAARDLAPEGMVVTLADLAGIPLYDEDLRASAPPATVEALRLQVREADGLLLATPEYNYSFSGVLKNAIDWVSRPPEQPFQDKPIAIVSASPGMLGGSRAQYQLRQCFIYLDAKLMSQPEVMVGQAGSRFDAAGELTDAPTRALLTTFLASFRDWIERIDTSRG